MAKLETVPAKAVPENGLWCDLHQERPRGLLPMEERKRVAAYLKALPEWGGVVLIVGDVSHWVQISAGEIVSFQSFLTGRLAQALGVEGAPDDAAVADVMSQPERLAGLLRSAEIAGESGAALGALIGAELAATRAFWLGADVRLMGEGALADGYEAALRAQAAWVTRV
ncbi:2-dehydro-3-deoxygalactonokinase [Lentibacter sp. XHP0401]|uniref:2-dehydro-3-deoxygalactonokinase n=1 Tax=Lentibacter sp. XHP0401 TaxID=2984334 RepID=UPI0021E71ABD|nr:2-dehydro-3-deoxygalactonokinase [Lentibacter sp. XHP0401]MCV2894811.1 2-dehydro-3-deoxygalactonokinase [Lentibacter sp. XHP0401]